MQTNILEYILLQTALVIKSQIHILKTSKAKVQKLIEKFIEKYKNFVNNLKTSFPLK